MPDAEKVNLTMVFAKVLVLYSRENLFLQKNLQFSNVSDYEAIQLNLSFTQVKSAATASNLNEKTMDKLNSSIMLKHLISIRL